MSKRGLLVYLYSLTLILILFILILVMGCRVVTTITKIRTSTQPSSGSSLSALRVYSQILSTGQSLSIGELGNPALSTIQPFSNLMLNADKTTLIPLVEPATGTDPNSESMSSGLANMISSLAPNFINVINLHGVSGYEYGRLKKGTPAYQNGITQAIAINSSVQKAGGRTIIRAVTVVHGESDEYYGTTATQYENDLVEWQNDYQTDSQALTSQTDPVPLFTDQMSSWTTWSGSRLSHLKS